MAHSKFPSAKEKNALGKNRKAPCNPLLIWGMALFVSISGIFGQVEFPPGAWVKKQNREGFDQLTKGDLLAAEEESLAFLKMRPDNAESHFVLSIIEAIRNNPIGIQYHMLKSLDGGIAPGRFYAGPRDILRPLHQSTAFHEVMKAQEKVPELVHGPMLGQLQPDRAAIWVRTRKEADVAIHYRCANDTRVVRSKTTSQTDYTTVLPLTNLLPGREVDYEVHIDGEPNEGRWTFRTPESGKQGPTRLRIGFGGGAAYEPELEFMWDVIASWSPDVFLMLGDNVYIDHPESPATQQYCYYRRQSHPNWRRLIADTAIFSIWDDHDFTVNDGWGGPEVDEPDWKRGVWDVFKQNWVNPAYGLGEDHPGCFYHHSLGEMDLIMLDGRYYREDPKTETPSMLGDRQLEWLFSTLKQSTGLFKILVSPVPWAEGTKPGSRDTWDGYPEEREKIFQFISREKIEGVILVSADRHRSDHWKIERSDGYPLHEFESSRLTNIHRHGKMPGALFSYSEGCSFGILDFICDNLESQVTYRIVDHRGIEIYHHTLLLKELKSQ